MKRMNFTNNQVAFEYALYMMLGSYFDKAVCKNKLLEKKMYVQYLEQKERNQILMEDICIKYVEKKLIPDFPKKFWEQEVEVKFAPTHIEGLQEIQFHGKDYILYVGGIYRGKANTRLSYQVKKRDADIGISLCCLGSSACLTYYFMVP